MIQLIYVVNGTDRASLFLLYYLDYYISYHFVKISKTPKTKSKQSKNLVSWQFLKGTEIEKIFLTYESMIYKLIIALLISDVRGYSL